MEIFKSIKGYENEYQVSDLGRVKSLRRNKILKPNIDKSGYEYYVFSVNSIRKTVKAHRLVAETFIRNPGNKPTVDHINGIKTDNRIENLRWASHKEQSNNPITLAKHIFNNPSEKMKLMGIKVNFNRKKVIVKKNGKLLGTFDSLKEASKVYGINYSKASEVANGKRSRKDGLSFEFA